LRKLNPNIKIEKTVMIFRTSDLRTGNLEKRSVVILLEENFSIERKTRSFMIPFLVRAYALCILGNRRELK